MGFSLVAASRGYSSLWCTGLSLRWLLLLQSMGSRRVGFSSCGARASLLRAMWVPPGPGLEPVSPALAGRFLTTVPSGKPKLFFSTSPKLCLWDSIQCQYRGRFSVSVGHPVEVRKLENWFFVWKTMSMIKKKNSKCWWGCGEIRTFYIANGNVKWYSHFEKQSGSSSKY